MPDSTPSASARRAHSIASAARPALAAIVASSPAASGGDVRRSRDGDRLLEQPLSTGVITPEHRHLAAHQPVERRARSARRTEQLLRGDHVTRGQQPVAGLQQGLAAGGAGAEQLGSRHEQLDCRQLPAVRQTRHARVGCPPRPAPGSGRGGTAARGGTCDPDRRARAAAAAWSAQSLSGARSSSTAARTRGWATSTTRLPPRTCRSTSPCCEGVRQRAGKVDGADHARQLLELHGARDRDSGDEVLGFQRAAGEAVEHHRRVGTGCRKRAEASGEGDRVEFLQQRKRLERGCLRCARASARPRAPSASARCANARDR